jgi:hypothetical protein
MPRLPNPFHTMALSLGLRYAHYSELPNVFDIRNRGKYADIRLRIAGDLRAKGLSWPKVAAAIGYGSHTSLMERYNEARRLAEGFLSEDGSHDSVGENCA